MDTVMGNNSRFDLEGFFYKALPVAADFCIHILIALAIFFVGRKLIKWMLSFFKRSFAKAGMEEGAADFLLSIIKFALFFVLILLLFEFLGLETGSVIALLGSAGLAVGLALQGSLANFAGGVLILLLRPFHVDDYIISGETGHEGTVKEITTFYTRIQTADNQTVMIPNGKLADGAIVNVTGQQTRRVDILVGIAYSADLKLAKSLLWELAQKETRRLEEEPVNVFVSSLADSGVELGCRFWVKSEDYWQTRWDMLEAVKLSFDGHGVEIPFPQVDVHMKREEFHG